MLQQKKLMPSTIFSKSHMLDICDRRLPPFSKNKMTFDIWVKVKHKNLGFHTKLNLGCLKDDF